MSVKTLIAEGKLEAAAVEIVEALRHILSRSGLGISLTKDEFFAVMPTVIEVLTEGLPEKGEPTDAPGDDIEVLPATANLTVKFEGPKDDNDFEKFKPFTKKYAVGATYTFVPYTVVGYTPDQNLITGKMPAAGKEVTITYTKDAKEEEDKEPTVEEPTEKPKAKHTLSIEYVGPEDDTDFTAPDDYLEEYEEGAAYSVTTPEVEGYTADKATVAGTMGTADVEETVTFTKEEPEGEGNGLGQ